MAGSDPYFSSGVLAEGTGAGESTFFGVSCVVDFLFFFFSFFFLWLD